MYAGTRAKNAGSRASLYLSVSMYPYKTVYSYICVYTCIYVHVYIHTYIYIYIYINIYIHIYSHTYVHIFICVCVYICVYVSIQIMCSVHKKRKNICKECKEQGLYPAAKPQLPPGICRHLRPKHACYECLV